MMKAYFLATFCALALLPGRLRADPGDALDTGGGGIAARYVRHAQQVLSHEHVTEALALSQRALDLLPDFAFARFTHGQASMAGGHYEDAVSDFSRVIAQHPEFPFGFAYRAIAYLRARKAEQAIADLNRALTSPVGMGDALASAVFLNRSLALQLMGRDDAAIADFQRGLAPLTGKVNDYGNLALVCYTAAVINLLPTAELACDESIARSSRNIIAYEARTLVHLKQGAWDKTMADAAQSLYYRSDQPTVLYARGLAKRAKGDTAGAAIDMRAARDIEPDIAPIMTRLGVKTPA